MTDPTPEQYVEAKRILDAHKAAQERKQREADRLQRMKEEAASLALREQVAALWPLNWRTDRSNQASIRIEVVTGVSLNIYADHDWWTGTITTYGDRAFTASRKALPETVEALRKGLQDMGERMVRLANVKAKDTQ